MRQKDHPLYWTWHDMIRRCYNPCRTNFKWYGGRGIRVCDRWRNDFWAFVEDMGERPEGYQLDRIDNDGDYTPENCRWVTPSQNCRNTKSNRILEIRGEKKTMAEWAEISGTPVKRIESRLRESGWPPEAAVFTPLQQGRKLERNHAHAS